MVPVVLAAIAAVALAAHPASSAEVAYFEVPRGAHPHDVAPAPDGGVWYTAQFQGALGILNPKTGQATQIALGAGSSPHGVIVGPDRAAPRAGPAIGQLFSISDVPLGSGGWKTV